MMLLCNEEAAVGFILPSGHPSECLHTYLGLVCEKTEAKSSRGALMVRSTLWWYSGRALEVHTRETLIPIRSEDQAVE